MCRSWLGEESCAVPTKANKVARALYPFLGLALCTHAALAQQVAQQAPARVGVLGVPGEKVAAPSACSDTRKSSASEAPTISKGSRGGIPNPAKPRRRTSLTCS